jgi:hypothetical protein
VTSPNPFDQAPSQQPAPGNPFPQPAAQPAAQPAPANPFPAQQQAQPAPANPFPAQQQAQAPQQPQQWNAGVATYPAQQQTAQAPAPAAPAAWQPQGSPPALNAAAVASAPVATGGGGQGPELPDMYSRLVIFFPLALETVPRNPKFITEQQRAAGNVTQERMTATIVILDSGPGTQPGGTIAWGGAPHEIPPRPHTNNDPLPCVVKNKWISQTRLIQQCRPFLPAGPGQAPGIVAGRPAKTGPAHNDPWYLVGASPEELALVQKYIELVMAGQYPHPLAP